MSEMVERVARALCEDCGLDWSAASQDSWRRQARAAIEAMREPTDAMKLAGIVDLSMAHGIESDIWRAMIDEALK